MRLRWSPVFYLAALALLPAASFLFQGSGFLADPLSELPVKLWGFETFGHVGVFGGTIDSASWPLTGSLNNPDPLGTLVYLALKPLLGRAGAYNLLVLGQLFATLLAGWALGRDLCGDEDCGLITGVALALSPLCLVYCVQGSITDMLNLWPYPLAVLFGMLAGYFGGLIDDAGNYSYPSVPVRASESSSDELDERAVFCGCGG